MSKPRQLQLFGAIADAQERASLAFARVEHLDVYGPGLTFGELAIGEQFYHARPIKQMPGAHWPPPRGPLVTKTSATQYQWDRGIGTAEDYYRVERA